MNTTLNKIRMHSPCKPSWEKLLTSLNKTKSDDEPLSFNYILETLGIKDTIWCLRTIKYRDYCLFNADVAESVLHIYEKLHPKDSTIKDAIIGIRDWHNGDINILELNKLRNSASASAYAAASAAAANSDYDAAAARSDKWAEIEALFNKYFC